MSEAATVITEDDPVLATDFAEEMLRQMRAIDTYGTYDKRPPNKLLEPFILTKEKQQEMPMVGDPDALTMARVQAFYNAISAMIEKECGLMAVPMMSVTHEGFGRAVITVGKLVVMDKTLRDVHRFGFSSLSKMKDEADKLLSVALEIVGKFPAVAGM
jgi:probable nitrogen fixation protein